MTSYHVIISALDGFQQALRAALPSSEHFLHKHLKDIAMRSRERDTMPLLSMPYTISEGQRFAPLSSAAPAKTTELNDLRETMSAETLIELSRIEVSKNNPQSELPEVKSPQAPSERTPPVVSDKKKSYQRLPDFMRSKPDESQPTPHNTPRPKHGG